MKDLLARCNSKTAETRLVVHATYMAWHRWFSAREKSMPLRYGEGKTQSTHLLDDLYGKLSKDRNPQQTKIRSERKRANEAYKVGRRLTEMVREVGLGVMLLAASLPE
jgi:hypothetical protein